MYDQNSTISHISIPVHRLSRGMFSPSNLLFCLHLLFGQEMSKSSESDGFSPIPQTARCRVWQCLISRSGIPVNLQAVVLFKINCLHSLARNCI